MDFPEPAGPHMKMTRGMIASLPETPAGRQWLCLPGSLRPSYGAGMTHLALDDRLTLKRDGWDALCASRDSEFYGVS